MNTALMLAMAMGGGRDMKDTLPLLLMMGMNSGVSQGVGGPGNPGQPAPGQGQTGLGSMPMMMMMMMANRGSTSSGTPGSPLGDALFMMFPNLLGSELALSLMMAKKKTSRDRLLQLLASLSAPEVYPSRNGTEVSFNAVELGLYILLSSAQPSDSGRTGFPLGLVLNMTTLQNLDAFAAWQKANSTFDVPALDAFVQGRSFSLWGVEPRISLNGRLIFPASVLGQQFLMESFV